MQSFVVEKDQLESRYDPDYYHPERLQVLSRFKSGDHKLIELRHLTTLKNEKINPQQFPETTFNYLSLANIASNVGEIAGECQVKGKDILSISNVFKQGDILFGRLRPYLNKVFLARGLVAEGICSTEFVVFTPKDNVNPLFLHTFLLSNFVVNQTRHMMTGNTLPRLTKEDLYRIKIPLPPREIQDKIASLMDFVYKERKEKLAKAKKFLDSIEDYILDQLGIKLTKVEDKKRFVTSHLDLEDRFDPIFYLPKYILLDKQLKTSKCEVKKLGEIITKISGGATPKAKSEAYTDKGNGVPFLRIQNIGKGHIDLIDVKCIQKAVHNGLLARSQLRPNDLLFTITGRIGTAAVVPEDFGEGNINQHMVKMELKEEVDPRYVEVVLNSVIGQIQAERKTTGTTRIALDYPSIKSIKIPLPPIEIQNQIAEEVKRRQKEAECLRQQAEDAIKQAKEKVEKMILGEAVD